MWYVRDVLYAVLYVRVSCFVVRGCGVSRRYIDVCYCDMFIGIHILMAVVEIPSYRMYWHETTRYEPVAGAIGRNRSDQLRTYIHMNHNTNVKQND